MKGFPIVLALLLALAVQEENSPEDPVRSCTEELFSAEGEGAPDCWVRLVRHLSPRVLEERWEDASEGERLRFDRALSRALRREIADGGRLVLRSKDSDGRSARLVFGAKGRGEASLLLHADASGELVLADVVHNGDSLVRRFRALSRSVVDRYSLPQLLAELDGSGVVVLEDFEDDSVGELPRGWKWRAFGEATEKPYRVVEEEGHRFLRAEDRGENVMLYKEVRWDARKYPYLGFRFRIRAVPEGADERIEERADSAAGLYLSYDRKLGIVPETVKFVWSGSLAAGSAFRRPGIGMPWTVVAGSGAPDESRWHRFVYHAGEVYETTFGKGPIERPLGIGLLTDANSTGSFAAADYDDIVALARAEAPHRIREIVPLPAN